MSSITEPNGPNALPSNLERKLTEFRGHVRVIKVAEGILAAIFGFTVAYFALFCLERFVETNWIIRATTLLIGTVGLALYVPFQLHRWVWGTRRMDQVARILRRRFPRLGDNILGVVELAQAKGEQRRSAKLIAAAMAQVDATVADRDLTDGVPNPRHKKWAIAVLAPVLLVAAAWVLVPAAAKNALIRFLNPWSNTPRYTFAQLEALPEKIVVPYAEPFSLVASLGQDTDWRPGVATVKLSGMEHSTPLVDNTKYPFELPGQMDNSQMWVTVGDAWTSTNIIPTVRPELLGVAAKVTLPEYLQYAQPLEIEARSGSFSILRNSQVQFTAVANRELKSASMDDQPVQPEGETIETSAFVVGESSDHRLTWQDEHGLTASKPFSLRIRAVEDRAPSIFCNDIKNNAVLLVSQAMEFSVVADDDFGLRRVGLEWEGIADPLTNPDPAKGERTVLAGAPEAKQLVSSVSFSGGTEGIEPQTLQLRAFTEDYSPEHARSYSPTYLVHVMSEADHAQEIFRQFKDWLSIVDGVREAEIAAYEENKILRNMSAEERDRPENRKRIQELAVAERKNAAKLEAVSEQGRKLLEQALPNESIQAGQIQAWAEGLKMLGNIAENRMPSIANLLEQVATARAATPKKEGSPSSPDTPPKSGGADSKTAKDSPDTAGRDHSTPSNGGKSESDDPGEKGNDDGTKAPGLIDKESSMDKGKESEGASSPSGPPPKGALGLPDTVLKGDPPKSGGEAPPTPPQPLVMDGIVEDHTALIEEFRKARDAFAKLMANFENGTFVKRLKAASRIQTQIATSINRSVGLSFGVDETKLPDAFKVIAEELGIQQSMQSQNLGSIQFDLESYQNRSPDQAREAILKEMQALDMLVKLEEMPKRLLRSLTGDAINRTEFWADTFDRWAEELVAPPEEGASGSGPPEEKPSLPPALLLELMRIIDAEIDLRGETRTVGQSQEAIPAEEYEERAIGLAVHQMSIQERTLNAIRDIQALPNGASDFADVLGKVGNAVQAMDEATSILTDLNTGEPAVAAETAAIEAMLEARRAGGSGGSGGGETPGDGDKDGGLASRSALELVGPGADRTGKIEPRETDGATGNAGDVLPEEYREGFDQFVNGLSRINK